MLQLLAIGKRSSIKIPKWYVECSKNNLPPNAYVVLFKGTDTLLCLPLRDVADQLFEKYMDGETSSFELSQGRVSGMHARYTLSFARKVYSDFRSEFANFEVHRSVNILMKPKQLQHLDTINRAKRDMHAGQIDPGDFKRIRNTSSRDFDVAQERIKKRARHMVQTLKHSEFLSLKELAESPTEFSDAMRLHKALTAA